LDTNTLTTLPATPTDSAHNVLLQWSAPSQYKHDRSSRWYLIAGIVTIAIAAYGILTGAWTLTLVTLLVGGVYYMTRHDEPALKDIRIERDGVDFDGTFTPWAQCKDFWLIKTPQYTELHIMRNQGLNREIRVHVGDIDPTLIRSTVSQFLTMRPNQHEHILDLLIRLCKL
jgi:hypothetical protein